MWLEWRWDGLLLLVMEVKKESQRDRSRSWSPEVGWRWSIRSIKVEINN